MNNTGKIRKILTYAICLLLCASALCQQVKTQKNMSLAFSGIASSLYDIDTLSLIPPNSQRWKTILARDWGVTNRNEVLALFSNAERGGYSQLYSGYVLLLNSHYNVPIWKIAVNYDLSPIQTKRLFFAQQTKNMLSQRSLKAWDYGSMISIARWACAAGYISEQEAWEKITYYADLIYQLYNSWEDYAANYLLGRGFYYISDFERKINEGIEAYNNLVADKKSPWSGEWILPQVPKSKTKVSTTLKTPIASIDFESSPELQAWNSFMDAWTSYTFGDSNGAIEAYAHTLELDPQMTLAYINQAQVLFEQQRYTEALIPALIYTEKESSDHSGFSLLFKVYVSLNQNTNALRSLETALYLSKDSRNSNPSYFVYLADKGIFLFNQKEYKKALPYLEEAAHTLQNPALYAILGDCYYKTSDISKAQEMYTHAYNGGVELSNEQINIIQSPVPRQL